MPASLDIPIVSVVGSRHSGKTTAVEAIVKGLTDKGYRVAAVKHIHQPDFTIDTKGRDTWRHAQAGARIIVAVSTHELTTIRKVDTRKYTLNDIAQSCQDNVDVIVIEGFRNMVAKDQIVPKIVTVKNKREISEAASAFKPIIAMAGSISKFGKELQIPLIDVNTEPAKLIEIIEKRIGPIIKKRRELSEEVIIDINGKKLPMNPYVQKVTRNVLFGLFSTLKDAKIEGNENIQITITKSSIKSSR